MPASPIEKPLHWVASSKKDLVAMPADVVDDFGYALGAVQMGAVPPQAKAWKGEGAGVLELVESRRGDAFRVVYTVRFERAVYVLHCFQKKSPSGSRTAKVDVDLIHQRLQTAQLHYLEHYKEQSHG
jgi:phage-related protein